MVISTLALAKNTQENAKGIKRGPIYPSNQFPDILIVVLSL